MMQNGSFTARPLKNLNFKNPVWRTAVILKTSNSPYAYLCNRSTVFDKIWHGDAYWSQNLTSSNNRKSVMEKDGVVGCVVTPSV